MGIFDRFKKGKGGVDELQEKQKDAKASELQVEQKIEKADAAPKKEKKETKKAAKAETKNTEKKADAPAKKPVATNAFAASVLIRPFISEKSALAEQRGTYTFVVSRTATKVDIKRAVTKMYGVKPAHVRVVNQEGKRVRFGRIRGRRSDWKKAYVTLPKGQTITIHEGV